ncbi:ADP-ribosylglycohydrolase family protein [Candidatus Woesearchaeota archaeon]|nr:ADP-ribosylglycohydrolase family protein [Candidatus Woesearchaeota archaeon]
MTKNIVLDGLFGLCVADALGVPVEFVSREKLKKNPVRDMIGFGAYNQPPGTWSDDSSLAFCLAESLCKGFNLNNIAQMFCKFLHEAYWTPWSKVFDAGVITRIAIANIRRGVNPVLAGGRSERDNGNGSLMRILPIVFFVKNKKSDDKFRIIAQVSSITHGHIRSIISCAIYVEFAINILKGQDKEEAYENMKDVIIDFYKNEEKELKNFSRILKDDVASFSEEEINSTGYVVDTLEAALWCFLNTSSYKNAVLTAVNLGNDTDTVAAVTGGLAGIYYGFEKIPKKWINQIARKEDIIKLAEKLNKTLE